MKNGRNINDCLFCDCETDLERSQFFASGRAYEVGVIASVLSIDVARAFFALEYSGELTFPHELTPNASLEGRGAGLPAERPSRSDCSA